MQVVWGEAPGVFEFDSRTLFTYVVSEQKTYGRKILVFQDFYTVVFLRICNFLKSSVP